MWYGWLRMIASSTWCANIRVTMGYCTCFLALKVHQGGAPPNRLVTFVVLTTLTDPSGTRHHYFHALWKEFCIAWIVAQMILAS
jgi:hypothetical protein